MKSYCLLAVLLSCILQLKAQRLQYARRNAVLNYPDGVQLVANISGRHHLISFTGKQNPVIHIYNQQLELLSQKKIPYNLPPDCEVKVKSFNNYYYIYIYARKANTYRFWKIDGQGIVVDLTGAFSKLLQSAFKQKKPSITLAGIDNHLYIFAHTHFSSIGKIATTIVQADSLINPLATHNVFFDFGEEENFHQAILANANDMLILKTGVKDQDHILELLKIDIHTGDITIKGFKTEGFRYSGPSISHNQADSSTLVYAKMGNPGDQRGSRPVFICKLDHLLNEKQPMALLRSRVITASNFLSVDDKFPWITFFNYRNPVTQSRSRYLSKLDMADGLQGRSGEDVHMMRYTEQVLRSSSIRFSRLNEQMKTVDDSVLVNNDPKEYVSATNFGQVRLKNKSYLLLAKRLRNRNGLSLIYTNEKNQIVISELHVYDKNDYIVSQLQPGSARSIILPYVKGREGGLLKIDID